MALLVTSLAYYTLPESSRDTHMMESLPVSTHNTCSLYSCMWVCFWRV